MINFSFILLILIKITNSSSSNKQEEECCLKGQKKFTDPIGFDFNNFSELNFQNCNNTVLTGFTLLPDTMIVLDDSLDFKNIILHPIKGFLSIYLFNLKGFNLESNPFQTVQFITLDTKYSLFVYYIIEESYFDFYFKNNNTQIKDNMCTREFFKFKDNMFTKISGLDAASPYILYKTKVCPLIFARSKITYLSLSSTNSLFIKNSLIFLNISDETAIFMNSFISVLDLHLYHINLDENILNRHVFEHLKLLTLNGVILSILDDLFKSFNSLKMLHLKVQNIRNLFQKNNKWLQYLNKNVYKEDLSIKYNFNLIFTLIIEQVHFNHTFYDFPNEDYCYFKDFPHQRLVMPFFKPTNFNHNSCTYLFLIQYSRKYVFQLEQAMSNVRDKNGYVYPIYYDEMSKKYDILEYEFKEKCKIFLLINKCDTTDNFKSIENNDFYFYIFDWNILTKYNQIIFSIILNPLFGLICIIVNLFNILILNTKHIKKQKKFYTDLKMNYFFILAFNIVSLIKLLYVCMNKSTWNDAQLFIHFCMLKFQNNGFPRYFNIILIKFFGNVFKSCFNFYYSLFTINRYVSVSDTNNHYLKIISKINFKKKLLIIVTSSLVLNLYTYFQFSNYISDEVRSFRILRVFSSHYELLLFNKSKLAEFNSLNDYAQELEQSSFTLINAFNLIKIIFSDLFFALINLSFDVCLFVFISKSYAKKMRILANVINSNNNRAFRKLRFNKISKNKAASILILNGLNFLLFRSPLIVLSFYGYVYRYDAKSDQNLPNYYSYFICRNKNFCNLLAEIAFFFYLISILFQFWIFFKIDTNFKIAFKNLKAKNN